MKEPRTDKRINVGKVAEVLAINPNKTIREIAEETGLSIWATHSNKKEVEQSWTKDETISYIVGSAKERLKKISSIFDYKAQVVINRIESWEEVENRDISLLKDIAKDDIQRITVLWWTITDEAGWLKSIDEIELTD